MLKPLVVDLDGTLIKTDLLYQSLFSYVKRYPLALPAPFVWLSKGKSRLKEELARHVDIDVSVLPYNQEVLEFIKAEREKNRRIILATASHRIHADRIAEHLQVFDEVMATEGQVNFSSSTKRDRLVSAFGANGYDYVGNSHADVVVWESAEKAYLVNPESTVERRMVGKSVVKRIGTPESNGISLWLRAMRTHQWLKNVLLFVPLIAAHRIGDIQAILTGLLAFLLFSLCASSVYILNDLMDMEDDRHHRTKRTRPFASGDLSIKAGIAAFLLLLLVSLLGSWLLMPWQFTMVMGVYYSLTIMYSFVLKKIIVSDIIILSLLYTTRILAGSYAFNLLPTYWMLAFSMFFFLSLALVKRYSELRDARENGKKTQTKGRGYYPTDLEMIASLGAASGYLSVMVLALYIQDPETVRLYNNPKIIWLACPVLLFWITRVWLLAHRGAVHDDPVIFAVTDKASIVAGVVFGMIFVMAAI
ncbi:MAG: UbiA family prenyltransferase [Chlorobiaceae bacterium]|nr:UbiA family prenyltransferase [Chlorobiaceae bacterium]